MPGHLTAAANHRLPGADNQASFDNFVKLVNWYDLVWGFSNRLVDLAKKRKKNNQKLLLP